MIYRLFANLTKANPMDTALAPRSAIPTARGFTKNGAKSHMCLAQALCSTKDGGNSSTYWTSNEWVGAFSQVVDGSSGMNISVLESMAINVATNAAYFRNGGVVLPSQTLPRSTR